MNEQPKGKKSLGEEGKGLKTQITDFVKDVATLDVITLTGDLKAVFANTDFTTGIPEMSDVIANMLKSTGGEVEYVAFTHYEFDCDSVSFYKEGGAPDLLKIHNETAKAAMEARRGMVEMAAKFLGSIFPK